MPTILVLDVDGTLRGPGEMIGDGVAEFLREQANQGVGIVPCSGKSADELDELFSALEVPVIAIGAENGGHVVHDPRGGVARREMCMADVDGEALRKAREHIDRCRQCGPWIAEDPKRAIITRRFGNPTRAVEKARIWRDHVSRLPYFRGRRIEVYTYPGDTAVDLVVNSQNVHKGLVVRFVRAHHPHARIVVAGDGLNDLSMLRAPRVIPVCPANALPEVQAVVRHAGGVIAQAQYGAGTMEAIRMAMRMGRQLPFVDSASDPA